MIRIAVDYHKEPHAVPDDDGRFELILNGEEETLSRLEELVAARSSGSLCRGSLFFLEVGAKKLSLHSGAVPLPRAPCDLSTTLAAAGVEDGWALTVRGWGSAGHAHTDMPGAHVALLRRRQYLKLVGVTNAGKSHTFDVESSMSVAALKALVWKELLKDGGGAFSMFHLVAEGKQIPVRDAASGGADVRLSAVHSLGGDRPTFHVVCRLGGAAGVMPDVYLEGAGE